MHPRFETPIFYYRPYPGNPMADAGAAAGLRVPARPRGVGGLRLRRRARPVDQRRRSGAGRAVQVLHAARLAAGRVALAAARGVALALRSRLVRLAGREGARRAGCVRRSRCRDGHAAGARLLPVGRSPTSSGSCGRIRRSGCCICRRISRRAASTSASSTARSRRSTISPTTLDRERPPVVGIAVNLMTKRNALRMIAIGAGRRRAGRRRRARSAAPRGRVSRRRRRRRGHRRRGADARRVAAASARRRHRGLATFAGIVFERSGGWPTDLRDPDPAACADCPISTRQPFPDRAAVDLDALPARLARASRLRAGVAHHRARLSVHLHVVQPIGLRHDPPPPVAWQRRRRSRSDRRPLPSRSALVCGRRVCHSSRVDARLRRASCRRAGCACRSSASRAPSASTTTSPTRSRARLLARVDRRRKADRSASSTRCSARSTSSGSRTRPLACAGAASRSACSSCSATTASGRRPAGDGRAPEAHGARRVPDDRVVSDQGHAVLRRGVIPRWRRPEPGRRRTDRDLEHRRSAVAALLRLRPALDQR